MTTKRNSQHVFDYAVIGAGLSGLAIANALSRISSNIILIDAADSFGGFNRMISSQAGPANNGLRFLPDSELSHKAIAFLEMLLTTSLNPKSDEQPPVTYDSTGIKAFLGFGDQPPAFYEEIAYFTANKRLHTSLEPHQWTQLLFNSYTGDFAPRSFVTKLNDENGRITNVTINGQKKINAHNFIYCAPTKQLAQLLPENAISNRARLKLNKNQYWTAVCVDLVHPTEVTSNTALHILNGTTQDDLGPCVGQFHPAIEDNKIQLSQWLTFVDSEEAEDTEVIGAALKKIKRQIKRAYPAALEALLSERILVVPEYSGNGDLKVAANQSLPGLENLFIGSASLSSQKNLLGALLQAELVCSSLGCHPLGSQIETAQENEVAP